MGGVAVALDCGAIGVTPVVEIDEGFFLVERFIFLPEALLFVAADAAFAMAPSNSFATNSSFTSYFFLLLRLFLVSAGGCIQTYN